MKKEVPDSLQIVGFDKETESYKSVVITIISAADEIINYHSIPYDSEFLRSKVETLTIVRRDGEVQEYVSDSNTIYLSSCNQERRQFDDEEMVVALTHELMHLVCSSEKDCDFYWTYFGYDEFFTEYLTSLVVSKIGGIKLESYYNHNVKGYFGNDKDINFIKKLCDKIGFKQLLGSYVNREIDKVENLVGKEILVSMNDYYDYYCGLYNQVGKPLKKFNQMIEDPSFTLQKEIINSYVDTINQKISTHEIPETIG